MEYPTVRSAKQLSLLFIQEECLSKQEHSKLIRCSAWPVPERKVHVKQWWLKMSTKIISNHLKRHSIIYIHQFNPTPIIEKLEIQRCQHALLNKGREAQVCSKRRKGSPQRSLEGLVSLCSSLNDKFPEPPKLSQSAFSKQGE